MALPDITMRQLLEAGVHFGHQTHRWNPKMAPYIYGSRNNIHIIDLTQTVPLLHQALVTVSDVVAKGGRVLFVGTKRQASEAVADAAKSCAQYFINHRWLGGTLTNWRTISNSIKRLKSLEELLEGDHHGLTKKELLQLTREKDKLERSLGGIKDMGAPPDLMFVIDTNKESIAIAEARKLDMPVVAIVDSNCDPDGITIPFPAMTTPAAPSPFTATSSRAPRSTASSGRKVLLVSISALPRSRSASRASRALKPPRRPRRRPRRSQASRRPPPRRPQRPKPRLQRPTSPQQRPRARSAGRLATTRFARLAEQH